MKNIKAKQSKAQKFFTKAQATASMPKLPRRHLPSSPKPPILIRQALGTLSDIAYTAAVYEILLQASVRDTAAVELVAPSTKHKCMNVSNVNWIMYY